MSNKRTHSNSEQDISSSSNIISVSATDNIAKLMDLIQTQRDNGTSIADLIISVYYDDNREPSLKSSTKNQKSKRQKKSGEGKERLQDEYINVRIGRSVVSTAKTNLENNESEPSGGSTAATPATHEGKSEADSDENTSSSDDSDTDQETSSRNSNTPPNTRRSIWWMHIETEITVGFFETADDGLALLEKHELEPWGNGDGSYQAYFEHDEHAYEDPLFGFFYRRNSNGPELITLEEVGIGRQICFEHDE
ncbi:hypothetical protein BGZ49_006313 [Haplosporangium sp. Z 27]|nr:hypothetical protein BGZ49_006313 [Haplosporangium sp. Z 27]